MVTINYVARASNISFSQKKNHIGLEQHKGADLYMCIHTFGRCFYLKRLCIYIIYLISLSFT